MSFSINGMVSIDKKQIEHFKNKGYLILRNFFASDDVEEISKYMLE